MRTLLNTVVGQNAARQAKSAPKAVIMRCKTGMLWNLRLECKIIAMDEKRVKAIPIGAVLEFIPNGIKRIQRLVEARRQGLVVVAAIGTEDLDKIKAENPKIPFVL